MMMGFARWSKLIGAVVSATAAGAGGGVMTARGRGAGAGAGVLTSAAAAGGVGVVTFTGTDSTAVGAVWVLGCVVGGVLTGVCIDAADVVSSIGFGVL
jgi:hypothetical protein